VTTRILAQDGNVIQADFRKQSAFSFQTQILFCDPAVVLMRITYFCNGEPVALQHLTVDLTAPKQHGC
jgi:hypothetical protein